jgi:hypothetical protein
MILLPDSAYGTLNTPNIRAISLPSSDDSYVGSMATVSGNGATDDASQFASQFLRHVPQTIIDNVVCEQNYGIVTGTQNIVCTQTTG